MSRKRASLARAASSLSKIRPVSMHLCCPGISFHDRKNSTPLKRRGTGETEYFLSLLPSSFFPPFTPFLRVSRSFAVRSVHSLQHRRRQQFLLNVPLNALGQKTSKISASAPRPWIALQPVQRRTKHFCRLGARVSGNFRTRQPFIILAQQAISQGMKICLAAVQHSAAHHAGMQVRQ